MTWEYSSKDGGVTSGAATLARAHASSIR